MNLSAVVSLLEIVAPLAGVDATKLQTATKILNLLAKDNTGNTSIIEMLEIVAPLAGVDATKAAAIIKMLKLLAEDEEK
jgi:hypothetical protein